tara:strand:- start:924 stop:1601 length:678 start_codon:yes stop_codon:yes gene_type:complete
MNHNLDNSSTKESDIPYTAVTGEIELSETESVSQPAYSYYIIPTHSRKRKQCCGISCCFAILIFLLCFILIPKSPQVYLNTLYYNTEGITQADFVFKNKNYYNMRWKNPDISLYWIPYDGQNVGHICYGDNEGPCDSNLYYKNMCAIKLGEFKSEIRFKTNAISKKKKQVGMLTSSQQEAACVAWMILNPYENKQQRLITTGSIYAKGDLTDFKKIKILDQYYYL